MSDIIDKRVSDLEDLLADIPRMLSLRLETITTAQQEATARIGLLDKQMAMLVREVRDLRNGVTRQLTGQDERLGSIEAHLVEVRKKLDKLLSRLP